MSTTPTRYAAGLRTSLHRCSHVLAGLLLLAPARAIADDVILVPEMQATTDLDPGWAETIQATILQTLTDNGFVVIDAATVRRVAGDVLDRCAPADRLTCTREALHSTPGSVALQLALVSTPEGGAEISVEFYAETQPEPVRQLSLPIEMGKERRIALQIAMFALDVVNEVGPSSPGVVQAARTLVGSARPTPQPGSSEIKVYGSMENPALPPEEEPEDLLADDPEEDLSDPDSIEEDEPIPTGPKEEELPNRLLSGVRRAYDDREDPAAAWYKKRSPHAGRFLIELRGGFGHSDLNRQAYSLADLDAADEIEALYWTEGPIQTIGGRVDGFIGYAPATMLDFGVVVGVDIASDIVVLGIMEEGQDAEFGEPEKFTVARPVVQPRLRLWPVQLGPVKPYIAVGMEFKFVGDWTFDVEGGQPLARPPGGVVYSVVGGLGLSFDPHPRVGILLGADLQYHLGKLAKTREVSTDPEGPSGNPFPTSVGAGFTILPGLGVQIRL